MSVPAVGPVATTGVQPTGYLASPDVIARPEESSTAFAGALTSSIEDLQASQSAAKELAVRAVTGDLDDVHDYTIAASEAAVALELTAAIRNKAVDAFTEIMRMQA